MILFKKQSCNQCGASYRKPEELMHHQQLAHEPKQYECRKCGGFFDGMEQMRDHAKRMHSYNKMKEQNTR